MSSDQYYACEILLAKTSWKTHYHLAQLEAGIMVHSRLLTLAHRILRY